MPELQIPTDIEQHLLSQYEGVFDERQMARFIDDYLGFEIAENQVQQVMSVVDAGARLLDVGAGFGSFIIAARRAGLDARGIDLAEQDVKFARERLAADDPAADAEYVFSLGDGLDLPFEDSSFDAVTLWNVLEHVPDERILLREVARVLRPGGRLFFVCPNYAAFRREAHYQVFWPSLLPRRLASIYLRMRGKNPAFFEENIFYRTNLSVLRSLRRAGFLPKDALREKIDEPERIKSGKLRRAVLLIRRLHLRRLVKAMLVLRMYNPLKSSVVLYAVKRQDRTTSGAAPR